MGPWKRVASALSVALAVFAVAAVLRAAGAFEPFELKTFDARMRWLKDRRAFRDDIVFINISQASLNWAKTEQKWGWPWPRDVYGHLLRYAMEGGARCVVSDIGFTEPDVNGAMRDAELGEAAAETGHYFLATPFTSDPSEDTKPGPDFVSRFTVVVRGEPPAPRYASLVQPVPEIWSGVARIVSARVEPDDDGVTRRYPLLARYGDGWYPSMALAILLETSGATEIGAEPGALVVGDARIPIDDEGQLLLHYGADDREVTRLDSHVVISSLVRRADGETFTIGPDVFRDKIVIIAAWAPGLLDLKATPLGGKDAGAVIHGTAASNLLNRDFLRRASPAASLALLLVLTGLVALATRLLSVRWGALVAILAMAGHLLLAVAAFKNRLWIDVVPPAAAAVVAYGATNALNYLIEGRRRARIRRAFQQYVAPHVVEKILRDPKWLRLEGERKTATILFLDFAGFTTLSERLPAEDLVKLLVRYNDEVVAALHAHEGTLDKFIGDAVMAFWNDPIPQEDHEARACLAAVEIQERLATLGLEIAARGLPPLRARIGINSGSVTIGNMGAAVQFNYTAIGDPVNLASRIEGVNKEFGTSILATEMTVARAADRIETREIALIQVKGRHEPVRIYEILGVKGRVDAARLADARRFEEALALLRARRWVEARAIFASLADDASRVYADACDHYAAAPPSDDWDGTYVMTHK